MTTLKYFYDTKIQAMLVLIEELFLWQNDPLDL